jgi:O-antigen ligase
MFTLTTNAVESPHINTKLLSYYLWAGVALLGVALIYAIFNLPARYLYLVIAVPVAFIIVISPRLALYQFVLALFLEYPLVPSVPVYLIDCSMVLVILAGSLDFFLTGRWPLRLPRLTLNYVYIVGALIITGLFGFWPELMPRRVLTTCALLLTFLAVYRLSSKVPVLSLLRLFVGSATVHSMIVLIPFLASGGTFRSFGFHGVLFDDQAMVALPVAVGLYLSASKRTAIWNLLALLFIAGGLTATQSRAPMAMGAVAALFVIWLGMRQTGKLSTNRNLRLRARGRAMTLILFGLAGVGVAVIAMPQLFSTVLDRFGVLFSADPTGTTAYRLALWKRAIVTFMDYPLMGVGPGGYYRLSEIYSGLHIVPDFTHLRGLGAHNILLHFLADTGLVGGLGLAALVINQFRLGRASWRRLHLSHDGIALALMGWVIVLIVSTLIEASWMWGQLSFLAVFFAALVARQYRNSVDAPPASIAIKS